MKIILLSSLAARLSVAWGRP